jgi:hypothetical protein
MNLNLNGMKKKKRNAPCYRQIGFGSVVERVQPEFRLGNTVNRQKSGRRSLTFAASGLKGNELSHSLPIEGRGAHRTC